MIREGWIAEEKDKKQKTSKEVITVDRLGEKLCGKEHGTMSGCKHGLQKDTDVGRKSSGRGTRET